MDQPRIDKIVVGDLEVIVESHIDMVAKPRVIKSYATCGETMEQGSHTLHPKHDREQEHLEKDHMDYIQKLAKEAAGHERSRLLLVEFGAKGSPQLKE